jgi:hypothetical protein
MDMTNMKLTTPEMDLIDKIDELGEFITGDDGYVCYAPNGWGLLSSWELRTIADELDKRNETWNKQVIEDLDRLTKEAGMEDAK